MPAPAPPAIIAPCWNSTHSGRLKPSMATLPPGGRPSAIIDRATARI